MKKILLLWIGFCIFFCSCKSIWNVVKAIDYALTEDRMSKKTEITYYYGEKRPFVFEKSIFIPCKINDIEHLLLYDSGITDDFLELIPGNAKFPKKCKTMKQTMGTSSTRVTVEMGLKYCNIESDFFNFKKFITTIMSVSSDTVTLKCISGIHGYYLGMYAFPKRKNTMLLNFSDTTITLLDSIDRYDTANFMLVKSFFSNGATIRVYLTIDSVEYGFLFDTGSNGFLSLSQHEKHKKENDVAMAGFVTIDASGIVIDTSIIQQANTIIMGNLDSIKGTVDYKTKLTSPIMGMKFISNFDWIIDRYRKEIYAKKIKDIEYEDIVPNGYRVDAFDTTLQISLLPVGETEYQLFSIIDSVNGEKVNTDNICQMRELLNKRNGFKDNKIVILPLPKIDLLSEPRF